MQKHYTAFVVIFKANSKKVSFCIHTGHFSCCIHTYIITY